MATIMNADVVQALVYAGYTEEEVTRWITKTQVDVLRGTAEGLKALRGPEWDAHEVGRNLGVDQAIRTLNTVADVYEDMMEGGLLR